MSQNHLDDFDTVSKPENPVKYKYFTPLPKKHSERKRLPAHTCAECEKYFNDLPAERLEKASRHRGPKRPPTPEHFWDLDFPDYTIPVERLEKKPMNRLNKYDQKSKWPDTNTKSNDNIIKPTKGWLQSKPLNKQEPFF
ncbi:uncharacterized protein CDAR_66671 [Caerostris darwini]|uniref:DNA endonuclease activator Ctp1 C-terminal domain-containing protein n=1 Tax=Caerostris darwini TaxID=1538125 RepID=A0AAV4T785_9ARAC|nr:uncharacterized protein CDAR_66671 [Caerostris darwini]